MESLEKRREQFISRYPEWEELTLYQRFRKTASCGDDKIFFIDTQKQYTYKEILDRTDQMAAALKAVGIGPGTCVAAALSNCVEFVSLTFALAKLGAVKVPIHRSTSMTEIRYILHQSEAKLYITERKKDRDYQVEAGNLPVVVYLNEECEETANCHSWNWFIKQAESEQQPEIYPDAHAVSDIIYTSGSTGTPKGVMLSHDMLLRSAFASCINRGFEPERRIYVPLPLFHVYGYVEGLLAVLFVEGSILVTSGKFESGKALQAMSQYGANDILSVPTVMMKLLQDDNLEAYNLEKLHAVYCSASVCPKWVWREIRDRLQVQELITGYGMSEVSGASMQTDPTDDDGILQNRVGKVLYGDCAGIPQYSGNIVEYRVIDGDSGRDMPMGEYGELICRGPVVTGGYYHDPEANARSFLSDGWFRTGDIGYFDENGYLKFLGRCNDLYKINGENVSPQFLDKVISRCHYVKVVETVGVPDEIYGWVGVAFIDAGDAGPEIQEQIKVYCRENLAPFQVPKHYFFTDAGMWPQTATGKIMKYKLRELAKELLETKAVG